MAVFFPNVDPIYLYRRKKDEYLELVDTNNVQKQEITLKEIPLPSAGVTAKDSDGNELIEVKIENSEWYEAFPLEYNEFRVDYSTGVAYFNKQRDGEEITLEYIGTGYVNIPSQRIIMPRGEGEPIQTLQDALNKVSDAINILGEVGEMKFSSHYSDDTQYHKWNFVSYKNATYVALTDVSGEKPDESGKWQLVSSGVAFVDVYSSDKTYRIGNMVSDPDSKNLYMSKIDNNTFPLSDTDSWSKMISLDDMVDKINEEINKLNIFKEELLGNDAIRDQNEARRDERVNQNIEEINLINESISLSEQERITNENLRKSQEIKRKENEGIRIENENLRENQELIRQQNEIGRKQRFDSLTNDVGYIVDETSELIRNVEEVRIATEETNKIAQSSISEMRLTLDDISEWRMVGDYSDEINYRRLNMVKYDGGTYMALQDVFNIPPTNSEYWVEIARAGSDGLSITIEGVSADENGDISLESLNIVRNEELNSVKNNIYNKIGDLSSLNTLQKEDLVGAINELKRRIDDIISVM